MRVSKLLIALLALPLMGGALHARASERDNLASTSERSILALRGVNVLSGDASGYVTVRLEQDAKINGHVSFRRRQGPNPGLSIAGGGRFAGMALVKEKPGGGEMNLVLVAGRFQDCEAVGCRSTDRPMNYMEPSDDFGRAPRFMTIPKGTYRLYLVSDGSPVRVRFKLRGLSGRTAMSPQNETTVDQQPMKTTLSAEQGQSVLSAGNSYRLGSEGIILLNLALQAKEFKGIEYGACLYTAPTAPPRELSYGPHCSALMDAGLVGGYQISATPTPLGDSGRLSVYVTALFEYRKGSLPNIDDRHGAGVWYGSAGTIDHSSAQFVLITF